ncbi:ECF RNA polymerase sigma factor SigE [Gammaproteobacteria bacterium]|nr:ECF RNA polymerase sigma factor SigE [Gammaproteobacteria bacterium]
MDTQSNLNRLFMEHRDSLIHTLFRMVGCYQTAEDLTHEAYLRVVHATESDGVAYVQPYLYQTARNLALDHLRKEKVRGRTDSPIEDEEALGQVPANRPTPEQDASTQEQVGLLIAALAGLPERRRQIFLLHKFHHWGYERIAAHFGLSRSAVEKNVRLTHLAKTPQ